MNICFRGYLCPEIFRTAWKWLIFTMLNPKQQTHINTLRFIVILLPPGKGCFLSLISMRISFSTGVPLLFDIKLIRFEISEFLWIWNFLVIYSLCECLMHKLLLSERKRFLGTLVGKSKTLDSPFSDLIGFLAPAFVNSMGMYDKQHHF